MFPRPLPAAAPPRPYTVSELLAEVAGSLRSGWRDVSVVGEVGRWDLHGGHGYFTLKDRTSCLSGIIFSSDLKRVPFKVEPGLEIVARGTLDLYSPQGRFQLRALELQPVGAGALQLAFEQLKAKLAAEGLFDPARKRKVPLFPRSIGVVTSPEGAAIRDFLNVLGRRFGTARVTIYPVRVQGEGSARQIANAIGRLNVRGGLDVLIITRGGGSAEDLAPFNDEGVARALAASRIPTISAVGHETDVTICDLVADLRAPTPSAAAELVAEKKAELYRRVEDARGRILRSWRSILGLTRARLSGLSRAEGLLRFRYRLRELSGRVAQSRGALVTALERRPAEYAGRLARARGSLAGFLRSIEFLRKRETVARLRALLLERGHRRTERRRERLRRCAEKLELVSPLAVLARGYAVAYREGSKTPLLSASRVKPGDGIRVRLHEGEIGAVVRERKGASASPPATEPLGPLFAEGKGQA